MAPGKGRPPGYGLGALTLQDGEALSYTFRVYPVRAVPRLFDAAYGFSRLEGIFPVPLYLGSAKDLAAVLMQHDRRADAIRLGAVHLLVHVPDPDDLVSYGQAAERLIRWHRPLLNPGLPPLPAIPILEPGRRPSPA